MPETDRPPTPVRLFVALSVVVPDPATGPWRRRLTDAAVGADRAGVDALVVRRSDPSGRPALEPTGVLAVLAPLTTRMGLIAEASAAHTEPYPLAREVASLDTMSDGRAGLLLHSRADLARSAADLPSGPGPEAARAHAEEFLAELAARWGDFADHTVGPDPVTLTSWVTSAGVPAPPDYHVGAGGADGSDRPRVTRLDLRPDEAPEETALRARQALLAGRPAGLLVDCPAGPASLDLFVRRTLPVLRQEGLLSQAPPGRRSLRERLGLRRPADRSTRRAA